jgi:transcriptional regulator with PAS, ATPase and Fis domain
VERNLESVLARNIKSSLPGPPADFTFWGNASNVSGIWRQVEIAGRHDVPILIVGESGTGKEVLSRELWKLRRENRGLSLTDAPMVAVNSAGIPGDIAESLLFGHERGAFTSARDRQFGRFELARKGTLFLDELQCLELSTQSKLLRVLETKMFEPLGSRESKTLECQLIFASNIPLEILVQQNRLRKDLYYRLSMIQIYLPPLRDQKEILGVVCARMLKKIQSNYRLRNNFTLSDSVMQRFEKHSWPGNFRELEHVLLYSALHSENDEIIESELPPMFQNEWDQQMEHGQWF